MTREREREAAPGCNVFMIVTNSSHADWQAGRQGSGLRMLSNYWEEITNIADVEGSGFLDYTFDAKATTSSR